MAANPLARVLVIQTAFLGDAVLATGVVEKIHQHFPETKIDLLVRKGNESLFESHPFIYEVIIFDKRKAKYLNLLKLLVRIKKNKYDLVANIQRYFTAGLITVLSDGIITIGFDKNPLAFLFSKKIKHVFREEHEIERNHQLIAWFTDDKPGYPRLYPAASHWENIRGYLSLPFICMAPASVWYTKQYPNDRWVEIIQRIPREATIYLVGGSEDVALCEKIRHDAVNEKVINLAGKLNFLETAALFSKAKVNVVNDSAPMHIASAMNAPVCSIYCSTLPSFGYGPLSEKSEIIELKEELYCRPCGIHGRKKCPEKHFRCAYDLSVENISNTVTRFINS